MDEVYILVKSEGEGTEVRANIGCLPEGAVKEPIIIISKEAYDAVHVFLQPGCRHLNVLLKERGISSLVVGEGLISRALEHINYWENT